MRLGLLLRDTDFRDALVDNISSYDNDIYVEIIGKDVKIDKDTLLLTDVGPTEVQRDVLAKISERTVFLESSRNEFEDLSSEVGIHTAFKYDTLYNLLAVISDVNSSWRGDITPKSNLQSKLIACCSDSDGFSFGKCNRIAGQIIYLHGGSVLIIPLGYINENGTERGENINRFAKLMYSIQSDKAPDPQRVSYTDSYGISRLLLPKGLNQIAYLSETDLLRLIDSMSRIFDTVILDIGSCFRKENILALQKASHRVCFETARRRFQLQDILKDESCTTIRISGDSDEAMAIDDLIKSIYEVGDE